MDDNKYGYPYGGSPYPPRSAGGYPPQYPQQPRQPYPSAPQGQTLGQQSMGALLDGTQILTGEGFKPLSKQEREEAARIAAEAGFSFDGYQVVRREFFSHKFDPTLTIRSNGIIFNNACISKMDEVVYVQVLINPDTGKLVVRPCDEGARDAVRWCVAREDKRKSRQISYSMFTAKLYDLMGWETLYPNFGTGAAFLTRWADNKDRSCAFGYAGTTPGTASPYCVPHRTAAAPAHISLPCYTLLRRPHCLQSSYTTQVLQEECFFRFYVPQGRMLHGICASPFPGL